MNQVPAAAEQPKVYWSNEDCFSSHPLHFISAFEHKDYQIGMHSHEFVEMNIVTGGYGLHTIESMNMPVRAGDVFVIPSGILHSYQSENHLNVFHILIHSDFFRRYQEDLDAVPGFKMLFDIAPVLRQSTGEQFFLHLEYDALPALRQELGRIPQALAEEAFTAANIASLNIICTLSMLMNRRFMKDEENSAHDGKGEILRVMEYIQNHLEKKITMDELSAFANMSKSTLNRRFQQALHLSPIAYILSLRAGKARRLIQETRFTKAEIAQMCGFYDSSHMDKMIRHG